MTRRQFDLLSKMIAVMAVTLEEVVPDVVIFASSRELRELLENVETVDDWLETLQLFATDAQGRDHLRT